MAKPIILEGRIKIVEERFAKRCTSGVGDKAVLVDESTGWWIVFEGWNVAIQAGETKPDFRSGDEIVWLLKKRLRP